MMTYKMKRLLFISCIVIFSALSVAQTESKSQPSSKTAKPRKGAMSGVSKFAPKSQNAVPDLDQRLAKYKRVEMPFEATKLSARERQLVQKLVEASHYIEDIYWRQSDPEGLALYQRLKTSSLPEDKKVVRFLTING